MQKIRKMGVAIAASAVLVAGVATAAGAAPGDVDTSFGSSGVASVPPSSGSVAIATAVALDASGDTVVAGVQGSISIDPATGQATSSGPTQMVLARFTSTGAPDNTFGTSGTATVNLAGAQPTSVAVEPSGAVVATAVVATVNGSGDIGGQSYVLRFTAAGAPDATFGTSGQVALATNALATSVAIDSTGNVDVAGTTAAGGSGAPFIERFTPSGVPDATFGSGGTASLGAQGEADAVAIASSGDILAGGTTGVSTLWRVTSSGALDTSFGAGGSAALRVAVPGVVTNVMPESDGSVAVAAALGLIGVPVVGKFTSAGATDSSFGAGGVAGVQIEGGVGGFGAALIPSTGAIQLAGAGGPSGTWAARFNPDGTPDRTFGPDGKTAVVTTSSGSSFFVSNAGPVMGGTSSTQPIIAGTLLSVASASTLTGQLAAIRLQGGSAPAAPPADTASRLAGTDRIGTAIAVSQATFADVNGASNLIPAGEVVLASAQNFPDALVGTPLAASLSAPLLLSNTATLDPRDITEMKRVLGSSGTVTLLGGVAALSDAVAQAVTNAGFTVERIAGANRFQTAADVAGQLGSPVVLEATGTDFPDGVTAGAAAAHIGAAVLLTNGSQQAPETADYVATNTPLAYAVGGPAAAADPTAVAISGANRYDTAARVARAFFVTPSSVGVATGAEFPDALSGGARAAELGEPVLLTSPTALSPETSTYLQSLATFIDTADVFGGSAAVSDTVLASVQSAITGASVVDRSASRAGFLSAAPWNGVRSLKLSSLSSPSSVGWASRRWASRRLVR